MFFGLCGVINCNKSYHKVIANYDYYKEKIMNRDNFKNIELCNEKFCRLNNRVYHFLMKSFETFKTLIQENKELNKIALLKQNENSENEYIVQILNEIIKDNNKIWRFLRDSFQNSELRI